jgi:hypothetical protein
MWQPCRSYWEREVATPDNGKPQPNGRSDRHRKAPRADHRLRCAGTRPRPRFRSRRIASDRVILPPTTLAAHRVAPAFTIVPAHDDLGSNTIVCSPPDVVPLRFGEDSFYPHLDAARDRGIDPLIIRLPGIGIDIDHPIDLVTFLRLSPPVPTRTLAFLEQSGIAGRLLTANEDFE